ncbi:MAG: universal stress protein [Caulobacteraceae bacterium]
MYKCVLLAFDGTVEGRRALREGALLARCCDAQIHLLCVVPETPGLRAAASSNPNCMAQQCETYQSVLDFGVERLRDMGCMPTTSLQIGDPNDIIADYAHQVGADLIVVGHRKQNFLARWWSGSGGFLVDTTNCSLLIGRTEISDEDFEAELHKRLGARTPAHA